MTRLDQPGAMDAYEIAHRILTSSPVPGQERREAPRHPFVTRQWIAPYDGSSFPEESAFFQVRCHDLSQTGFSFVVPEKPGFSFLVISLGEPPNQMHMAARIVRCCRITLLGGGHIEIIDDETGGGDLDQETDQTFLVGCEFKGRLD